MILRARYVLPVSQPLIEDGAVAIAKNRITRVGRWRDFSAGKARHTDLGDVVLMPGLVNAHCHLDYTDMAGLLPPTKLFTDWLKLIVTTKAQWSPAEYAESWRHGAQMLLRTGTTTVGDIEAVPELLPAAWESTPLRVVSFLELIAITGRRKPEEVLRETLDRVSRLPKGRSSAGISPHAPYSTGPKLLRLSASAARKEKLQRCTHVAESELEFEMFTRAKGPMHEWLKKSGRDMSDCGLGSPVQHMHRHGALGRNLLSIHMNYLKRGDASLLATNNVSVAHCPRSHAYFRHQRFPLKRLLREGVNVCLGTDSLASVFKIRREKVELSMFEEMRTLAESEPEISPRQIIEMATMNGARGLGKTGKVGVLARGTFADLITISFTGKKSELHRAIIDHRGPVPGSMIEGHWAIVPPGAENSGSDSKSK